MDQEAELTRAGNWGELKRLYSKRVGYSWELAWVDLLRFQNQAAAVEGFHQALRDPRFEEASAIMLRKLGSEVPARSVGPRSLRFFDAYRKGELRPLVYFLKEQPENQQYLASILRQVQEHSQMVPAEALRQIQSYPDLRSTHWVQLGWLWDHKQRRTKEAASCYQNFFGDPWVQRTLDELRRSVVDRDLAQRLQFAYAQRDGLTLKRLFKALRAKIGKVEELPWSWQEAIKSAIDIEEENITSNLQAWPFWEQCEWSPLAIYCIKEKIFPEESFDEPPFVTGWRQFLESEELRPPPLELDPEALSLWQIRVELEPSSLSEALLKFPTEERFLFLWSLRKREGHRDTRQWPAEEKESDVVRKNLERAFERSSNKLLWFDRLRQGGCSQDFYEFVLTQIEVPVSWVLEDLKKGFLKNTTGVRNSLRQQLSVVSGEGSKELSAAQLKEALSYLTPAEIQEVLLSRFVLVRIPEEILTDEAMDLFWDARTRVGDEIFSSWEESVLKVLKKRGVKQLTQRHWRWVQAAWERDPQRLEEFSPALDSGDEFPWAEYLNNLYFHNRSTLLITCLPKLKDERLKLRWMEFLLDEGYRDTRIFQSIKSITNSYIRASFLARWYQIQNKPDQALHYLREELDQTPILNDQVQIGRKMIWLFSQLPPEEQSKRFNEVEEICLLMQKLGACDAELFRQVSLIAERLGQSQRAWEWCWQEWQITYVSHRVNLFERFLDLAFRSRRVEETQKILVQELLSHKRPTILGWRMLEVLTNSDSVFGLQHFRKEFIETVSQLFPLHEKTLKQRATYDVRAALLWKCFYGHDLDDIASSSSPVKKKRRFELWGVTLAQSQPEIFAALSKYINTMPLQPVLSLEHEFLEKAQRLTTRLSKQFRIKKKVKVILTHQISTPIRFSFDKPTIEVQPGFFTDLDEETWTAISVGFFQILQDYEQGLFDSNALMERFFLGSLLSGAPLAKWIRLCAWLGMAESLITPDQLRGDPSELMQELAFLNHLLICFLSDDFARKAQESGLSVE